MLGRRRRLDLERQLKEADKHDIKQDKEIAEVKERLSKVEGEIKVYRRVALHKVEEGERAANGG